MIAPAGRPQCVPPTSPKLLARGYARWRSRKVAPTRRPFGVRHRGVVATAPNKMSHDCGVAVRSLKLKNSARSPSFSKVQTAAVRVEPGGCWHREESAELPK